MRSARLTTERSRDWRNCAAERLTETRIGSSPWSSHSRAWRQAGQMLLILKIFRGEALLTGELLLATGTTLLLVIISLVVAIRLYERERILFGR
jgi:hypothetical protein